MHLFAIISSIFCIQILSAVKSDANPVSPNSLSEALMRIEPTLDIDESFDNDNQNDEVYVDDSTAPADLRYVRQMPSGSGSFLRFGRAFPFIIRFDRAGHNGGTFLRFGRQTKKLASNNMFRSGQKGEFLRFG